MSAQLPNPGEVFQSRYHLVRVLGEGGFARVFVATDTELKREVAIKILRPVQGLDERDAIRFEREARHVAQLSHPNIVMMFDYGRTPEGLLFTVFELVGGADLATHLEKGSLPETVTIAIMMQVLDALSAAHAAGLLHRDIKPANIQVFEYMGDPYRVKLLDFGIAKTTDGDAGLTATGMVVGTPRFMAPETLYGEQIGPASDIYSLGLVGYEMLIGESSGHVRRLVNQQPVELPPEVPVNPELRRVINRMLERQPKDRYGSARAVMKDLARVPAMEAVPAVVERSVDRPRPTPPPPSTTSQEGEPVRTSARTLAFIGVALLLVAVGAVAMLLGRSSPDESPPPEVHIPRALSSIVKQAASDRIVITPLDTGAPLADAGFVDVTDHPTGCGVEAVNAGTQRMSAREGLRQVRWARHVPPQYDMNKPMPLVILLHDDAGSDPQDALDVTGMADTADKYGFIIIAPADDALAYPWSDAEDIENIEIAVAQTRETMCIDADRIFALGYGAGGWGAEALSCHPWLRGTAIVSFVAERKKFTCEPQRQIPTLLILPNKSGFLPPRGGKDCVGNPKLSFDDFESMWRKRNDCGKQKTDNFTSLGVDRCLEWSCETPFVSCRINGGRRWPGAPPRAVDIVNCDGPESSFPYNDTIWRFFMERC